MNEASEGSDDTPVKPLAIWPILQEAILLPWARRRHFGQLIVLPTVASALIDYLWGKRLPLLEATWSGSYFAELIGWGIPHGLVFTVFAIACHRSILLGDHAVPSFGFSGWTRRETYFFGWSVLIGSISGIMLALAGILTMIPLAFLTVIFRDLFAIPWAETVWKGLTQVLALLCAGCILAYTLARLSLLFPATAVDRQPTLKWAWSESEKHALRLAFLVGVVPFRLVSLETRVFLWMSDTVGEIFGLVLQGLVRYCFATVEIAILSISFREISGFQTVSQPS
jgi:hypothetical protein